MRHERSDLKYIWDMLDAASVAAQLTRNRTLESNGQDRGLRYGVERAIEIIGEAARHVSSEFRSQHPEVPGQAIIATRHIFAHEYDDLQHDKVWRIATTHVPALIAALRPIIESNPPGSTREPGGS